MPGSRTTVRRNVNDETFGHNLSELSVAAFQKRINSDALIISGDGGEIHAHQVVLAKSDTLKLAMKSSDVRFQPEAVIIFPEFKKKSLVMMLQFLYTGEVDLISASELLVEFQELCRVLKLNPQVRKTKYVEGAVVSSSDKYNCDDCQETFDKAPKLIFHRQHCGKTRPSEVKVPVSSTDSIGDALAAQKSNFSANNQDTFQPEPVIEKDIVQDDFVKEDEGHENSNVVVNDNNEKDSFAASSGFRMPDNFDLPDEIIQEQLPAARYTSTPIRYGGSGIVDKDKVGSRIVEKEKGASRIVQKEKMEIDPSEILRKSTASKEAAKERSSLKKESLIRPQPAAKKERISEKQREGHLKPKTVLPVVEDLAEKRKRLMLKLRYDEDDIIDEKMRKQEKKGKKPFKDKLQPSSSLAVAATSRTQTTSKKPKLEKTAKKRRHVSSSSDDSEYDSESYDSDEDMDIEDELLKSNKSSVKRLLPSNKLSVVVQTEGKERIMELFEYKLKLQFNENEENQSEGDDDDDVIVKTTLKKKKTLKLEKIEKSIGNEENQSEGDDDDVKVKTTLKKKKTLKLEKVGKRIKRIVSEGSTSDDSFDFHTKKEPVKPSQVQPRSASPEKAITATSPGPSSPSISKLPSSPGPLSPSISKLPRIPKIQREPNTILPAPGSAAHSPAEDTSPKPGPSKNCDFSGRTTVAPPQTSASPPWPISTAAGKSFNEKRQMNIFE